MARKKIERNELFFRQSICNEHGCDHDVSCYGGTGKAVKGFCKVGAVVLKDRIRCCLSCKFFNDLRKMCVQLDSIIPADVAELDIDELGEGEEPSCDLYEMDTPNKSMIVDMSLLDGEPSSEDDDIRYAFNPDDLSSIGALGTRPMMGLFMFS